MDPHQHHHMQDDTQQQQQLPPNSQPAYPFYPSSDGDHNNYGLVYPSHQPPPLQPPYQIVNGSRPSSMSESDMLQYQRSLQMMPPQGHFTGPVYNASPPHGDLQLSASPPPPSPSHIYDPLSPNISGSDTGPYRSHSRGSNSSAGSPSSSRGHSFANRGSVRYNPTPSPTSTSSRRSRGRSVSDEEDPMMGVSLAEHLANTRKEATRRQRIEAEQRRRDELRDGYARLKDVLPVSNQKSSKVSLLERATNHIMHLEKSNHEMQTRLAQVEMEVQRLRALNEKISLGTKLPGNHTLDQRPVSSSPDNGSSQHSRHNLTTIGNQNPPQEDSSPSASEQDY